MCFSPPGTSTCQLARVPVSGFSSEPRLWTFWRPRSSLPALFMPQQVKHARSNQDTRGLHFQPEHHILHSSSGLNLLEIFIQKCFCFLANKSHEHRSGMAALHSASTHAYLRLSQNRGRVRKKSITLGWIRNYRLDWDPDQRWLQCPKLFQKYQTFLFIKTMLESGRTFLPFIEINLTIFYLKKKCHTGKSGDLVIGGQFLVRS